MSSLMTEVKTDRKYSKDHEWALTRSGEIVVGISAYALAQLGNITVVNVDVKPGDKVEANKAFGTVESVKTLSEFYCPVSGTVVRVNIDLEQKPDLLNEDPWEEGWMIAIAPSAPDADLANLLDAPAYDALVRRV